VTQEQYVKDLARSWEEGKLVGINHGIAIGRYQITEELFLIHWWQRLYKRDSYQWRFRKE
jgi:hypothetical protein